MEFDGKFSMEFCLVLVKTFPWNSMEFHKNLNPWNSVWYWDMEFYENIIYRIPLSFPQELNSMEFCLVMGLEFNEKVSMEFDRKLVFEEFRTTSVTIFLQTLISTELDKNFITSRTKIYGLTQTKFQPDKCPAKQRELS